MTEPTPALDVVAIGNAIVDVLAAASVDDLTALGLTKGAMTLIDTDRAHDLYDRMGPALEMSGGAAANTAAGVASLGGRAAFMGRVAGDQLGEVFRHDIRAAGVVYETAESHDGLPTGRCLIFITPDADRTMNTYLGAANELMPDDIDTALVSRGRITYLEGYLWDPPHAKEAFRTAISAARDAGQQVAFSLSDVFCVEHHRTEFTELLTEGVDLVFGNTNEAKSLFLTDDLDDALGRLAEICPVVAITRGAEGSSVVVEGERVEVGSMVLDEVVDTTGAGDLYAAGFLWGWCRGRDPHTCGRLGALAAAEVISHPGARPERSLAELAAELGLI